MRSHNHDEQISLLTILHHESETNDETQHHLDQILQIKILHEVDEHLYQIPYLLL